MENIREIVLDGLLVLERESIYSNKLIADILDKYDYLEPRDKAFMKRCFEGTVERRIELDYHIDKLSSVPVRKMKPLIRCLLRMSAYQILYMDSVPDSATINEAVKLAKKRKFANLSGFVNGNLRSLSRTKDSLCLPDIKKTPVKYLSVKYSVPEWIVEGWIKTYDVIKTESILKALLEIHPVSIRFDSRLEADRIQECIDRMKASGISASAHERLGFVYRITGADGVRNLPGYDEGLFTVQDVSSALAVTAADIKAGDTVIDACASPGGKSLLASEKALKVISRDVSDNKIARIDENAERMGRDNIFTQVWDAAVTDEAQIGKADVLILDVPCSGLGILGKKRDIKYNISPEGIKDIVELQWKIVEASWKYVKEGGTLLYSTCTINPEENEKQVERICRELPFSIKEGPKQLLPDTDDCDGFFYAVLTRKCD